MIGTVIANSATPKNSGQAAGWQEFFDGGDTHLAEPNVVMAFNGDIPHPTVFGVARHPVDGLRAIVYKLVRTGIPRLPTGPPLVSRMGQGYNRASLATPRKINRVQQYVPAPSAQQTGDWYQNLDNYR